jgi:ATP-dependent exoDNAse (exonuclease V) beta subunit
MSEPLRDQADRDRFQNEIETSFCVSAGAGVGKTTAIVNRIAEIAQEKPEMLSRLVVVTFAKAAAEELRARARVKIFGLAKFRENSGWRREVLQHWPRAFFGTIHSFCLRLIVEEGHSIGVPDELELCEGIKEEECWMRFYESGALDSCALPEQELTAAMRFYSFEELLKLSRKISPEAAWKIVDSHQSEAMPRVTFERALADEGKRAKENTEANQDELRKWITELESDTPFLKLPAFKNGSKGFKEAFAEELAPLVAWLERALGRVTAGLSLVYRDFRLQQEMARYDDQVQWALRLIETPEVLRRLRQRELVVILDEAQDTDAAMFSILCEIVRPVDARFGEWPAERATKPPRAGSFCFVGDEQQTIYSDRADPAVYGAFIRAFENGSGGERLEFSVTMRCPASVVEAVNAVFFKEQRILQRHVAFRELAAKPDAKAGAVWKLALAPIEPENVTEAFLTECEQVARFLAEQGLEKLGVKKWGDVAVICPRRSWLTVAADCFQRAGIPARLLSGKRFVGDQAAASWPAALAHVALHPWDEFERFGVLREVFGVSDRAYARWKKQAESSDALMAAERVLERLRALLVDEMITLSAFFEQMLDVTELPTRLAALGWDLAPLEALRVFTLESECAGMPLREWATALRLRLDEEDSAGSASPDAVSLLTGMKAKGLEWPVVVALGIGRDIIPHHPDKPYCAEHAGEMRMVIADGALHEKLKVERKTENCEKWQREFYVTMTRAKHLLILPDSRAFYKRSSASMAELCKMEEILDALPEPSKLPEAAETVEHNPRAVHASLPPDFVAKAVVRSREIPALVRPHELAEENHVERLEFDLETPSGGVNYGLWWHETMQFFPWKSPNAQEAFLQGRLADLPDEDGLLGRGTAELKAWQACEFTKTLRTEGAHFLAELPFVFARDERSWVEGVVDLVVTTSAGERWIVDWKTDRRLLHETDVEMATRLVETYGPQLRVYAEALAQACGKAVSRLVLFSTVSSCAFDVRI